MGRAVHWHHKTVLTGGNDRAWSPDRRFQAGIYRLPHQNTVYIWDAADGTLLQRLAGHHRWDVSSGECVRVSEANQGTVQSLRRSPDATKLASCGDDGAIMIWDLHSGDHLQTMRRDRPYERLNITGIQGLAEAQNVTLRALGAVEDHPV